MASSELIGREVALSKLKADINKPVKLLICAASFETRSLAIPKSFDPNSVEKVVILKNHNVAGAGEANCVELEAFFSPQSKVVEITKLIAIQTADRIAREIRQYSEVDPSDILVDITCMTHETLLILFSLIGYIFEERASQIQYLYCPAAEYDPGREYEEKWLSRGIKDVRSVLGYPGQLLPSRRNRLVVLVGFEVNRSSSLIDVYEPASLGLGYGDDGLEQEHEIINRYKHERLHQAYPFADQFEFSPRNPYRVRDVLLADAIKHESMNLVVAPMNSKISTLGAALAARANPNIQLCYAPAVTYNSENYSKPCDCAIRFTISG